MFVLSPKVANIPETRETNTTSASRSLPRMPCHPLADPLNHLSSERQVVGEPVISPHHPHEDESDSDSEGAGPWIVVTRRRRSMTRSSMRPSAPISAEGISTTSSMGIPNRKSKNQIKKKKKSQPIIQTQTPCLTLEEYLHILEEYEQGTPKRVILDDFMPKGWRQCDP